jgi:hypothetical protein
MVLIIDTETSGLKGHPTDRVLEIGIAEYDERTGEVRGVYSSMVTYPDLKEHCEEKERTEGPIWIFRHSDLSLEKILAEGKDVSLVAEEVRSIVLNQRVTAYNVEFDFFKFLLDEPWNLDCIIAYDIMDLATDMIYDLADEDLIEDKELQRRLLREREACGQGDKRIRSIDAYRALCPEDPMKLEKMRHRAMDDAVMEGWVLNASIKIGNYNEKNPLDD